MSVRLTVQQREVLLELGIGHGADDGMETYTRTCGSVVSGRVVTSLEDMGLVRCEGQATNRVAHITAKGRKAVGL